MFQGADRVKAQFAQVPGTEIGNLVLLQVPPDILGWIQFRRVSGKKFQPQASSLLTHELPHRAAAMGRQAVPDNQQLARNMPKQVREKLDDLRTANGPGKQPEIKIPKGDSGHHGKSLPCEVVLQ